MVTAVCLFYAFEKPDLPTVSKFVASAVGTPTSQLVTCNAIKEKGWRKSIGESCLSLYIVLNFMEKYSELKLEKGSKDFAKEPINSQISFTFRILKTLAVGGIVAGVFLAAKAKQEEQEEQEKKML